MKKIAALLLLTLNLILAGCQTVPPTPPSTKFAGIPAKDFIVTVTCSDPATRFVGSIETDGVADHLIGMSTGIYRVSGHEIICEFKKTDAPGRLTLTVTSGNQSLGNSTTGARFGGVRAELFFVPPQERTLFTTF